MESSPNCGGGGGGGSKWNTIRTSVAARRRSSGTSTDLRNSFGSTSNGANKRTPNNGISRRPKLLNTMKMTSFRFSTRNITRGDSDAVPEDTADLYKYFSTCSSLTRIREEFRNAINEDTERKLGFGLNACARAEEDTGRLLLHSIGLNKELITTGGTAAAQSRVNQFVLQELLPVYPAAIVEEDDKGRIPFVEPIIQWIEARRAVRKWKIDTDRTKEKVALVAAKFKLQKKKRMSSRTMDLAYHDSDSDSEGSVSKMKKQPSLRQYGSFFGSQSDHDEKLARRELKMIVESSDDAMFCIDERGQILLTNDAAVKHFGHSKKEFIGSNISMICNAKDASHHGEYLERYLKTGEKRVMGKKRELLARKKDGSTFYIELGLTEVNLGGGKYIFCGFVKDITDMKRHRRSLERSMNDVDDKPEDQEGGGARNQARGIPPLVEWCFNILSEFVDNYAFASNGSPEEGIDDDSSLEASGTDLKASFTGSRGGGFSSAHQGGVSNFAEMRDTRVVEKVAAIPHLLEELLLVEDPEVRSRLFDMSIVHKVLFNVDSLGKGDWLIEMLDKSIRVQKQRVLDANLTGADVGSTAEGRQLQLQLQMAQDQCRFLAEGAVFYLEQVSELNIKDDLYVFHHVQMHQAVTRDGGMADMISTGDVHHFESHRNALFDAVGGLNGLVRRLCVLDDDLVKRAAATPVIRRLLDKIMFSPFATLAALFDGFNHFLLMISFRLGPAPALFHLSNMDSTFNSQQYLFASVTLMASVAYFGTKAVHAGLAKHALSENLFWSDFGTFWQLLDTVPLLMVLFCSFAVDIVLRQRAQSEVGDGSIPFFLRTIVAMTTPFLWLRIMAFVKIRNKQLATFILCSVEIMKDIKWFLLVLFAAMASFAQMWVSLTFDQHQSESQYYMEGYLKAYTMMLGDLDVDALRTHPLVSILFVIYTFGVTIVLLNILIAIVSDSYQSSFSTSKMMLGKARVMFVSELLSLKTFHLMWMDGKTGTTRRNVNYLFGIIAIIHSYMIVTTINLKLSSGIFSTLDTISSNVVDVEAVVVFSLLLFMIFFMKVTIAYVLENFNDTGGLKQVPTKSISRFQRGVNWFVVRTFSALSSSFDSLFDREDNRNEFGSSPASQEHRTDKAIQRSIEKSRKNLKSEMKGMLDQIQLTLREMEEKHLAQMNVLAESQQLMMQAIAHNQDENGVVVNGILDHGDDHLVEQEDDELISNASSISLDELGKVVVEAERLTATKRSDTK